LKPIDGVECLGKVGLQSALSLAWCLQLHHIAIAVDLLNLTLDSAGHLFVHLCLGLDALGAPGSQLLHLHLQVRNLLLCTSGIHLGLLHLPREVNLLFDHFFQVLNLCRSTLLLVLDGHLKLPQYSHYFGTA